MVENESCGEIRENLNGASCDGDLFKDNSEYILKIMIVYFIFFIGKKLVHLIIRNLASKKQKSNVSIKLSQIKFK